MKSIKLKSKSNKPWITAGLRKSMKTRDQLYKKWLISRDMEFLNKFKYFRNKITSINKFYRDTFYQEVLTNSKNSKKMWDNVNMIINKKRPSSHIDKLNWHGKEYQQPNSISNIINKFFCNISSTIHSEIPDYG